MAGNNHHSRSLGCCNGYHSWVKTYAIDDCLGIEPLYLCVCIQLIEVAYSECQIGIGEELNCLGSFMPMKITGMPLFSNVEC